MHTLAIRAQNLGKTYRLWRRPHERLSGALAAQTARTPWLPGALRQVAERHFGSVCREFQALRGVSFELHRGETVGIVGCNGSGKSTLLKLITGTLQPTTGSVEVHGRIGAMLELGSGFNPDFTGVENVYLSAAILGLTRAQIEAKFEAIADFAGIGDFMYQPVATYSSGMLVRLAFSVHSVLEPDILIVDEALSVGDELFRRKCFARIENLRRAGTTILFVSHDLGSVLNLTDRALLLHRGELLLEGSPKYVVNRYTRITNAASTRVDAVVAEIRAEREAGGEAAQIAAQEGAVEEAAAPEGEVHPDFDAGIVPQSTMSYDQNGATIFEARVTDLQGRPVNRLERRGWYEYRYRVRFDEDCHDVSFAMLIKTLEGVELGGSRSLPPNEFIPHIAAGTVAEVRFRFQCLLLPGSYFLNSGVESRVGEHRGYAHRVVDAAAFVVKQELKPQPTAMIDFLIAAEVRLSP